MGDPVQPRLQDQLAAVGAQAGVRTHEHFLEHVLGVRVRRREHLTHVREQPGTVAVVDDPEGILVPRPEQADELLVRAQPEKWGRKPDTTPS